jgi:eukaryotic-like serine/threonine-protein kinase
VLRASAALAASARTPSGDASAIAEARASARRVARLDRPWANPLAELMLGLCDKQQRKDEGAARHLRAAADSFVQADMALHACAANWHLGVLIGGDEGRVLVSSARASLVERGVKRPESVAEMLAPGLV